MKPAPSMVVVGTSLGGLHALQTLLGGLPPDFALPIAIVQHRGRGMDDAVARVLSEKSTLPVSEPEDKQPIEAGHVYVAPGDYHLLVERGSLALSTEAAVHHARPAIDVLFESAAEAYGPALVAVVLTGASHDGAAGAARVQARGGHVIVQDPRHAECPIMPNAALERVKPDALLDLAAIPAHLSSLLRNGTGAHG